MRVRENHRAWKQAHPHEFLSMQRKSHLKQRYGLTEADYWAIWDSQEGGCAICKKPFAGITDGHVDHDHTTGEVRGLLCPSCNKMLGLARDQPEVLISGAEYLQRHAAPPLQDAV